MFQVAYIGLGSNIGSPAGTPAGIVSAAMESLGTLGAIQARSSLYSSEPVGCANQPVFVNAAVALRTDRDPEKLLTGLLVIERSFGRDRTTSFPKGPRTLDLDLLLMGNLIYESPSLVVPHPELPHRRFVLQPLVEIAPNTVHPVLMRTMQELLAALPEEGSNRRDAVTVI
jgi:2-amino-4-hydroxy-6-hydroxymethyldihydropteridine diphosphokinase